MEKLLDKGASDVFFIPIYMKKNRPAYMLSLICNEEKITCMESIIFRNTTTIGIRRYKVLRTVLKRKSVIKETMYGYVKYKVVNYEDGEYISPEYEDVKRVCEEYDISFKEAFDNLKSAALWD